jgi:PIN domain nuclease of toxin-antitoxin system
LLDSNVFLWTAFDPRQLSPRAAMALRDPGNELVVSAVTPIELAVAIAKGRLSPGVPLARFYEEHCADLQASELPITASHALATANLPYTLKDPMDRVLAAQSMVERIPILTRDRLIAGLGVEVIW